MGGGRGERRQEEGDGLGWAGRLELSMVGANPAESRLVAPQNLGGCGTVAAVAHADGLLPFPGSGGLPGGLSPRLSRAGLTGGEAPPSYTGIWSTFSMSAKQMSCPTYDPCLHAP